MTLDLARMMDSDNMFIRMRAMRMMSQGGFPGLSSLSGLGAGTGTSSYPLAGNSLPLGGSSYGGYYTGGDSGSSGYGSTGYGGLSRAYMYYNHFD